MARSFTEATTDALKCSATLTYNQLSPLTLAFWINISGAPAAERRLFQCDDNDLNGGWRVLLETDRTVRAWFVQSNTDVKTNSVAALSTAAWHQVVLTWDGGLNAGTNVVWYIDGTAGTTGLQNGTGPQVASSQILGIGNSNAAGSNSAPCSLAAVGLWSRVLTAGEIALLAGGLRPAGITTGLVGDIPINGASPEHDAAANIDFTVTGTSVVADPPGLYLLVGDEDFWTAPIVQPQEFLVSIW